MSSKAVNEFEQKLPTIITESLQACMEAPEDDDGQPDWSVYEDFVQHLTQSVMPSVKDLCSKITNLGTPSKVSTTKGGAVKSTKATKSGAERKKNPYTVWVKIASQIRKGTLPGDEEFTVTSNFTNASAPSATKYQGIQGSLNIDGENMQIKDVLNALKSAMPDNEKDLTLSAICWGLMPQDFRDTLVATYSDL